MELIRLEHAELGYGRKPLLPPVDLAVHAGQRLVILGPNGGGKSTLIRSLLGLTPLLSGRRVVSSAKLRVGYVPQAHRADPVYPLTCAEVVLQGRYGRVGVGRRPGQEDRRHALRRLEQVGLGSIAKQSFRSLSGGQRQRTLLARALCGEPELLVLDEFTSELDPAGSAALLAEVSRLATAEKVSVVFVTHEISAAAHWSTEVALIDARHHDFQTGPTPDLLTGERLSRLYQQTIQVERRGERTVVFVESGGAAP